jgi:hypothetical protein
MSNPCIWQRAASLRRWRPSPRGSAILILSSTNSTMTAPAAPMDTRKKLQLRTSHYTNFTFFSGTTPNILSSFFLLPTNHLATSRQRC